MLFPLSTAFGRSEVVDRIKVVVLLPDKLYIQQRDERTRGSPILAIFCLTLYFHLIANVPLCLKSLCLFLCPGDTHLCGVKVCKKAEK